MAIASIKVNRLIWNKILNKKTLIGSTVFEIRNKTEALPFFLQTDMHIYFAVLTVCIFYHLHLAFLATTDLAWHSKALNYSALTAWYQYFIGMQENMLICNWRFFYFFFKGGAIKVSILWVLLQPSGSFEPSYIKAIRLFLYSFIHGSHPSTFLSFFPSCWGKSKM